MMTKTQQQSQCSQVPTVGNHKDGGSISDDPQLPKREIAFYLVALVSIITYAGYSFYQAYGVNPAGNLPRQLLKKGWMRKYTDIGEETMMEQAFRNWRSLILASVGYLLVSKVTLLWTSIACHQIVCTMYTIAMTVLAITPEAAAYYFVCYAVALSLSYFSYVAIWIVFGGLLYLHTIESAVNYMMKRVSPLESSANIYAAVFGYLLCRFVSLGHSMHSNLTQMRDRGEPVPTFPQFIRQNFASTLHYTFYMPYFWCGPILTYNMFKERVETRGRAAGLDKSTVQWVTWRCCRLVLWFFVLQLIYHNLPVLSYLYSLRSDDRIVYKHLSFAMFMHGQNFMLSYVQFYGWPAVLARLDGVQLLDWPDCISRVYSYSIMWRVFDRGLFVVIRDHIYLPIGGSKRGVARQLMAVFLSFAFISIFHGDSTNVRVWTLMNFLQLSGEKLAALFYISRMRSTVLQYLSAQNEKRLVGYIIAWNMMLSCGIIFFFLAGMKGFIVMPEFLLLRTASRHTPVWHMLTMQFAAYCAVQISRFCEKKILCRWSGQKKVD